MTDLSPDLFKQFQDALCHAFPKKADLMQMARFGLDENLDEITGGDTLRNITFNLIQHAESHGKLQQLIDGALTENPDNPKLIAFNATWKAQAELGRSPTVEAEAAPPNRSRHRRNSATSRTEHSRSFQPTTFPYDVFLSHSSADKPTVRRIAEMLRDAGLTVWFDEWIIQPGDSIPRKIQQGLQESRVLLLCMSDNLFGSEWAALEGNTFIFRDPSNEARRFVPIKLDDCTIPDMLAQFLYIDWRMPDDATQSKLIDSCLPATKENTEPLEPEQPAPADPNPQPSEPETVDSPEIGNRKSPLVNVFGSGSINAVALTPDEKQIVTGADDGLVRLWDLETLTCKLIMAGHQARVRSVAVTADGKRIISGSEDSTVKVWDLATGACEQTLEGHQDRVWSVAVTVDGKRIISGSEDRMVKVWNLSSGVCEQTLAGHWDWVRSVAVTADGKRIISGSDDGTVKVWALSSGQCEQTLEGHQASVNSVAVTADGAHIISGADDSTVKVWALSSGVCEQMLEGHQAIVNSVAVTADGAHIISGSDDGTVKVWALSSGLCEQTLEGHGDSVVSVAVTADGARIISGSEGSMVKVWALSSGLCEQMLEGHADIVWSVAVTADRGRIISGSEDNTIKVWNLLSGGCEQTLKGHTDGVRSVAMTVDGERIISGSSDGTIKIWDLLSGQCERTLEGHKSSIRSLKVTPDGQRIVTGSYDDTVKVWDLASGRCEQTFEEHKDCVLSVAVTPDSCHIISGSDDNMVKVWDASSGRCRQTLEGHHGRVLSVVVTPDGRRILTGSQDNTVKVWDLLSGQCEQTFEGHQAPVRAVTLTPDGGHIVSGSIDLTIKIWDLSDGVCIQTLQGHQKWVECVAVTPDGRHIISSSDDRTVRVWQLDFEAWAKDEAVLAVQYSNAKVVLVGDSGVGKSGLALRLAENRWEETESTHGMQVRPLTLPADDLAKDVTQIEREVWLWDLAGQSDYRLVHQLYMDETALALMIVNGQSDDPFRGLAHWERALGNAVKQPPEKLLVAARCDRGGFTVSHNAVQAYCDERGYASTIQTSAKTGDGCDDLLAAIREQIPWDRLPRTSTTLLFKTLKDGVINIKDEGTILMRVAELRQRLQLTLPELKFSESELRTVVRLLAGQGIVQPLDFGDFLLLQPQQINNYASAVVRCARNHSDEIGVVPERDVIDAAIDFKDMERLDPSDELILMRAMLQTFTERSLCLQQETDKGTQLVFPAYFKRDRPAFPDQPTICVTYGFRGLLDEIYSTLVVRLHHTNNFEMDELWRDAADFKTLAGQRAGLQMVRDRDEDAKAEIKVYFDADCNIESQVSFIQYVHEHLKRRGEEVTRVRTFVCPNPECGESVDSHRAQKRKEQGRNNIRCDECDELVSLNDLIEQRVGSDELFQTFRQMDEEAERKIDRESEELILVGHCQSIAGEAGQICRMYPNDESGFDGEIEFRDETGQASGVKVLLKFLYDVDWERDGQHRLRIDSEYGVFKIINESDFSTIQNKSHPMMWIARTPNGENSWMGIGPSFIPPTNFPSEHFFVVEPFTALSLIQKRDEELTQLNRFLEFRSRVGRNYENDSDGHSPRSS